MSRKVVAPLLFVGLCAMTVAPLSGQGSVLGAKGGLSVANVSTEDPELSDTKSRTGLVGGAFLSIGIGEIFAIQPEALFSQNGFSLEEGSDKFTAKLNYFEIPLLAKAMFAPGNAVRPGIYAGGVVAFESTCKIEQEVGGSSTSVDCDDPDEGVGEREKTDFGLVFGAEVQFEVGSIILLADGRYRLGLRNLNADPDETDSVKSRAWQFMAGVGFRLN